MAWIYDWVTGDGMTEAAFDEIQAKIDALEIAAGYIIDIDTSSFIVGDLVYVSAADTFTKADATDNTKNADGMVVVVNATTGKILVGRGIVEGLAGLTAGAVYSLSTTAGEYLIDTSGYVEGNAIQRIGRAKNTTTMLLQIGEAEEV